MAFVPPVSRVPESYKRTIPSIIGAPMVELKLSPIDDDDEVNVNLIPDVDAFTLTAVGFGLIAFNFLVLANVSLDTSMLMIA